MDNHPFPSFNHPFYPDGGHQQTFIDYGSISTLNLDINENGNLVTTSRHKHYEENACGRLVGAHPTIPLLAPLNNVFTDKAFPKQRCKKFERTNFKHSIVEQVTDFCRDHSDIAFQSSIGFFDEELECKPWDPKCFFPTIKKMRKSFVPYKRQILNPNNSLDRFCDLFVTCPLSKYIGFMKEDMYPLPKGLCEAMHDIPPKMLFELLNESIEQQKNEMFFFDILQGNTLAFCDVPYLNGQLVDGVVFYADGPSLEVLNASLVSFKNLENPLSGTRTLYRKPNLLSGEKLKVNNSIRQISAVSYEYGDTFVGTRSRYNCSFFSSSTYANDGSQLEITMKSIDNLVREDQPISLALSPFIPGEGTIIVETGQICIWHNGKEVDTRDVPSVAPNEKWPWYQCTYAVHPRCVLISNSVEADIMDFRASGSFSRNLFSITSKQVSTVERISAIQRNPRNTHHYFIATDQSLMIMDDRFIQHPVLKWRHHLQDPVQHIEVMTNVVPESTDTIVMVSGSQHHETHCYQYSNGELEVRHTFPFSGDAVINPPVSTVLQWKVSSYDEWPSLIPTSAFPISSVLEDRLSNPLIGICGIPMTTQEGNEGFTVLQMSSSGDLFYQPFIPDQGRNVESSRDGKNLTNEDTAFLKDWMNRLETFDKENCEFYKWPLKSNRIETDCGDLFRNMICLDEPHQLCLLCKEETTKTKGMQDELDNELDSELDNEVGVCPRCGIDVKYGRQLKKSLTLDKITCRKEMKLDAPSDDVKLVTNANSFQDPVSKTLLKNWLSDSPTPLNLGNTDETEKQSRVPTGISSSNSNLIIEEKKEDEVKKDNESEENSQINNEMLPEDINQPDKTQLIDSQIKVSLEIPNIDISPTRQPASWQSLSKSVSISPSLKQARKAKRKLNQSMGF